MWKIFLYLVIIIVMLPVINKILHVDRSYDGLYSLIKKDLKRGQVVFSMFTRSKNYLDRDLDFNLDYDLDRDAEDVPVYTGHALFNTTKRITLLFNVQSLLRRNPLDIWIKII